MKFLAMVDEDKLAVCELNVTIEEMCATLSQEDIKTIAEVTETIIDTFEGLEDLLKEGYIEKVGDWNDENMKYLANTKEFLTALKTFIKE